MKDKKPLKEIPATHVKTNDIFYVRTSQGFNVYIALKITSLSPGSNTIDWMVACQSMTGEKHRWCFIQRHYDNEFYRFWYTFCLRDGKNTIRCPGINQNG